MTAIQEAVDYSRTADHRQQTADVRLDLTPQGRLHTPCGVRTFLAAETFLSGLLHELREVAGEDAGRVLYRCGWRWGQHEMRLVVPVIERQEQQPLPDINATAFLEQWWLSLQAAGWGAWQLDLTRRREGLILIDLAESALVAVSGRRASPVCQLYAGLFAGTFSALTRTELAGVEIECRASGAAQCKFTIGTRQCVSAARALLRQGLTARELVRQLSASAGR